ncbi:type II secretion system protein J [Parapedobacter sp. GCM10030251]|uniref:PulJ/GspJ family protein n=1 Tax=Parapedobacter sp. GCM10030251 TaxID=3273419 RepID=UPI00360BE49E
MNRNLHKLPAFTIMETLVALVLTALTISFVYVGIRFVQRQGGVLSQQLDTFGQFSQFHHVFQADAGRADQIRYRPPLGLEFHNENRTILYTASDSVCIRDNGLTADTFQIRVDSIACWFGGARQEVEGGLVDQGTFFISVSDRSLPLSIQKHYSSETLIQQSAE